LERDIEKRRKNKKNVPRTSTLDVRVGPSQVDQSLSHIDDEPSPIYDNAIGFSLGFYSKTGHTQYFQDKKNQLPNLSIHSHRHKQLVHYNLKEEGKMHPFLPHLISVPLAFDITPELIKKALNFLWPSFVESKVVMKVWAFGFEEINLFWKKVHFFIIFILV
jgi:hypothetical protein